MVFTHSLSLLLSFQVHQTTPLLYLNLFFQWDMGKVKTPGRAFWPIRATGKKKKFIKPGTAFVNVEHQ